MTTNESSKNNLMEKETSKRGTGALVHRSNLTSLQLSPHPSDKKKKTVCIYQQYVKKKWFLKSSEIYKNFFIQLKCWFKCIHGEKKIPQEYIPTLKL